MLSYYGYPGVRRLCHAVKQGVDISARCRAIKVISGYLSREASFLSVGAGDILVPAPQHTGRAEYTLDIARAISDRTGAHIADVLACEPRKSLYDMKKYHGIDTVSTAGLYLIKDIPSADEGRRIFFVDNVISTGTTFRNARTLIKGIKPLVFALDEQRAMKGCFI